MPNENQTDTNGAELHTAAPVAEEKKYGPVIGIIVIIGLLVLGGAYLWGAELFNGNDSEGANDADSMMETSEDPMLEELRTQSSSNEISDIESDLEASRFESLDEDLNSIDAELESDLEVQ